MNSLKTLIANTPNVKNIIFDVGGVLLRPTENSEDISFNPIEENVGILKYLQTRRRLFCITDASIEQVSSEIKKFDFFKYFEDIIISDECGFKKDSASIYVHCIIKHNLAASATLFIDDREENIKAAKDAGLNTIKYKA